MTAGIEASNANLYRVTIANKILQANNISLSMSAPASNTHQAWLTSRTASFGKIDLLKCTLSHTMFSESHPDNVETLDIDLLVSVLVEHFQATWLILASSWTAFSLKHLGGC
jgi:hypothetical protein